MHTINIRHTHTHNINLFKKNNNDTYNSQTLTFYS